MKHKKLLWVLVVAGLSLVSAQTFADTTSTATQDRPPMHGSGAMGSGAKMNMLDSYLRTDLTDTEKASVKTLVEANRDAVKTLLESNGTGAISDNTKASIDSLQATFVTNMLQYITTDKQSEFTTKFSTFTVFKAENDRKSGSGAMDKPEKPTGSGATDKVEKKSSKNSESSTTTTKKQTVLEKKIGTLVDTKLATFSTDSEKLEWMNGVVTKLETVLEKMSSSSKKTTYKAIKSVLEERIDDLDTTDTSSDTSVDSLLQ